MNSWIHRNWAHTPQKNKHTVHIAMKHNFNEAVFLLLKKILNTNYSERGLVSYGCQLELSTSQLAQLFRSTPQNLMKFRQVGHPYEKPSQVNRNPDKTDSEKTRDWKFAKFCRFQHPYLVHIVVIRRQLRKAHRLSRDSARKLLFRLKRLVNKIPVLQFFIFSMKRRTDATSPGYCPNSIPALRPGRRRNIFRWSHPNVYLVTFYFWF